MKRKASLFLPFFMSARRSFCFRGSRRGRSRKFITLLQPYMPHCIWTYQDWFLWLQSTLQWEYHLPDSNWQRSWCSQHMLMTNRNGFSQYHPLTGDIPCWLVENEDIHNLIDIPCLEGLGKWTIHKLLENHSHHMFQHSLAIRKRISSPSHHHHFCSQLLNLKNSGFKAFSIPRKLRSPIQSVDH